MKSKTVLFSLLLIGMIVSPYGFIFTATSTTTQIDAVEKEYESAQSGWLTGWQYRKSHTITGSVGAGTDYQIRITVHRTTGTDSGDDVYVETKCRTDFSDIRFTDDAGVTLLDYWLESSDSITATFWVEVTDNLDSAQIIFVYYGNDSAISISNGGSTFPLFDDFNRLDSDTVGEGWFDDSGDGDNDIENNLLKTVQAESRYCHIEKSAPSLSNFVVHGKLKTHANAPASWRMAVGAYWGSDRYVKIGWRSNDYFQVSIHSDDLRDSGELSYTNLDDTWCFYKIEFTSSTMDFYYSLDGTLWVLVYSASRLSGLTGSPSLIIIGKGHEDLISIYPNLDWDNNYATAGPEYTNYADDVFVRKFVDNEPTHSSWGSEEDTTATTDSTTSGTFTPSVDPMSTLIPILGLAGVVSVVLIGGIAYSRKNRGPSPISEPTRRPPPPTPEPTPQRVPREISAKQVSTPGLDIVTAMAAASTTPIVIDRQIAHPVTKGPIHITSGFDAVGENLKLAVKVSNNSSLIIADVKVVLDVPNALEFVRETSSAQELGNISGGEFQSAIFWLRPTRCVDGEYGGSILYRNASGDRKVVEIPPKRVVNICPMLTSTERADDVFARLKAGSLSRNCASFEFSGGARAVLKMAESRLSGLTPVDHSENEYEDGVYLGYSYYVGETKYGESQFASEIQVSGTPSGGVLTLSVYSDDERILSGFFVDVMHDVRQHIEIINERMCPIATCSKCGGNIDLTQVGSDRIYKCEYCGTMGKASPWMD